MWTIARLTIQEALRRRAMVLSGLVALLLLAGAFVPITGRLLLLPPAQAHRIYAGLYVFLGTDILKFFASVFGIALASGAISAELERGVLSTILPKPITRTSVYLGKWLGLLAFVLTNTLLWDLVLFAVATYRAPEVSHRTVFSALPCLLLYPVVFTTLALFFSTFSSFALSAGLAILAAGIGWAEGIFKMLERVFAIQLLGHAAKVAGLVMPIGKLARWTTKQLGPFPTIDGKTISLSGPFPELQPQSLDFLYLAGYVLVFLAAGIVVLGRRDL